MAAPTPPSKQLRAGIFKLLAASNQLRRDNDQWRQKYEADVVAARSGSGKDDTAHVAAAVAARNEADRLRGELQSERDNGAIRDAESKSVRKALAQEVDQLRRGLESMNDELLNERGRNSQLVNIFTSMVQSVESEESAGRRSLEELSVIQSVVLSDFFRESQNLVAQTLADAQAKNATFADIVAAAKARDGESDRRIRELQAALDSRDASAVEHATHLQQLTAAAERDAVERADLGRRSLAATAQIESLQATLDGERAERRPVLEEANVEGLAALMSVLKRQRDERDALAAEVAQLKVDATRTRADVVSTQQRLEDAQSELKGARAAIEAAETRHATESAHWKEQHKNKHDDADRQVLSLTAQLDAVREDARSRVHALELEVVGLKEASSNLTTAVSRAHTASMSTLEELEALQRTAIDEHLCDIHDTVGLAYCLARPADAATAPAEGPSQSELISTLTAELQKYKSQLESETRQRAAKENFIQEARKKLVSETAAMQKQREAAVEREASLQSEVARIREEGALSSARYETIVADLRGELLKARQDASDAQVELASNAQRASASDSSASQVLASTNEALRTDMAELRQRLADTDQRLKDATFDGELAMTGMLKMKSERQVEQAMVKQLETEAATLRGASLLWDVERQKFQSVAAEFAAFTDAVAATVGTTMRAVVEQQPLPAVAAAAGVNESYRNTDGTSPSHRRAPLATTDGSPEGTVTASVSPPARPRAEGASADCVEGDGGPPASLQPSNSALLQQGPASTAALAASPVALSRLRLQLAQRERTVKALNDELARLKQQAVESQQQISKLRSENYQFQAANARRIQRAQQQRIERELQRSIRSSSENGLTAVDVATQTPTLPTSTMRRTTSISVPRNRRSTSVSSPERLRRASEVGDIQRQLVEAHRRVDVVLQRSKVPDAPVIATIPEWAQRSPTSDSASPSPAGRDALASSSYAQRAFAARSGGQYRSSPALRSYTPPKLAASASEAGDRSTPQTKTVDSPPPSASAERCNGEHATAPLLSSPLDRLPDWMCAALAIAQSAEVDRCKCYSDACAAHSRRVCAEQTHSLRRLSTALMSLQAKVLLKAQEQRSALRSTASSASLTTPSSGVTATERAPKKEDPAAFDSNA